MAAVPVPRPSRSEWTQHRHAPGDLPSIEHWIPTLVGGFGCDGRCIRDIRGLATEWGMAGYKEAILLIGKLLKKVCADTSFINPSAFVTQSVYNAIGDVQRKGRGLRLV